MSVGTGLAITGQVLQYAGQKKSGRLAARRGTDQRIYDEIAAGQAIAIGQRKGFEAQRQAKLLASRAVAIASAGGAGQDIDHLIADIEGEGIYRSSLAMFEAESEAERLKFKGELEEKTGRDIKRAQDTKALGTLLSAGGSLYRGTK